MESSFLFTTEPRPAEKVKMPRSQWIVLWETQKFSWYFHRFPSFSLRLTFPWNCQILVKTDNFLSTFPEFPFKFRRSASQTLNSWKHGFHVSPFSAGLAEPSVAYRCRNFGCHRCFSWGRNGDIERLVHSPLLQVILRYFDFDRQNLWHRLSGIMLRAFT